MISSWFRAVRDGFKGFARHGAMSVSSVFTVTITLLIIAIFAMFTVNVSGFTQSLESSVEISVMVDYDYEAAEEEDRINLAIADIPGVAKVTYSSKAEEFQYYIDSFEDESTKAAFEPFADDNPMHDAFYVEVSDGTQLASIAEQISQIEGVSSVNFGGTSATQLISALKTIRIGGLVLAAALSILAIFLISNTIKLTIAARADEIAIMRNVGARNGYIRAPFVVEGILIGALGAIIPMLASWYGYRYFYDYTGGYVIMKSLTLTEPMPFIRNLCLALLLIGMIVGLIGSWFSVTRYLRWKR